MKAGWAGSLPRAVGDGGGTADYSTKRCTATKAHRDADRLYSQARFS